MTTASCWLRSPRAMPIWRKSCLASTSAGWTPTSVPCSRRTRYPQAQLKELASALTGNVPGLVSHTTALVIPEGRSRRPVPAMMMLQTSAHPIAGTSDCLGASCSTIRKDKVQNARTFADGDKCGGKYARSVSTSSGHAGSRSSRRAELKRPAMPISRIRATPCLVRLMASGLMLTSPARGPDPLGVSRR
jgi:hypothetical protein